MDSINSPETDRRRDPARLQTSLPARCITLSGTFPVTLLDISRHGGRIEVEEEAARRPDPEPGETVVLQWGRYEKLGKLVWLAHNLGGVEFEELVRPSEIEGTRVMHEAYIAQGGKLRDMALYAAEWTKGRR
jgi:hypothetical protein